MNRNLVFRRIAEREFDDSIAWYESKRDGLGQEFRKVIEECIARIIENPERFPKIKGEVRRAVVLRRFPFVIHYLIEPSRILILSVFHTSRDPQHLKWRH